MIQYTNDNVIFENPQMVTQLLRMNMLEKLSLPIFLKTVAGIILVLFFTFKLDSEIKVAQEAVIQKRNF